MTVRVKSHIPITLDIGDGQTLVLGGKRLTFEEANALKAQYRAAQNAEGEESNQLWAELIQECFKKYVRLDSDVVIELADGEEKLRKAEDLLDFFGGDFMMLASVVLSVISQSTIGEKKIPSQSPTGSSPSSGEPAMEAPGPKPETTAESAESGDSAESAGASSEASVQSGSTDGAPTDPPSSSTSVPSLH